MQSVNEELQSTNEELETSKEELQSTNEELATVNSELQSKVNELYKASDDMNNLLAASDVSLSVAGSALTLPPAHLALPGNSHLTVAGTGRLDGRLELGADLDGQVSVGQRDHGDAHIAAHHDRAGLLVDHHPRRGVGVDLDRLDSRQQSHRIVRQARGRHDPERYAETLLDVARQAQHFRGRANALTSPKPAYSSEESTRCRCTNAFAPAHAPSQSTKTTARARSSAGLPTQRAGVDVSSPSTVSPASPHGETPA